MKFRLSHKTIGIILILVSLIILGLTYIFFKPSSLFEVTYIKVCEINDTTCHEKNLPYQNQALSIDMRVTDLLSRMTTAEKIGQMALIEKNSIIDGNDIAKYGLGGLMSGGGIKPENNTPTGWLDMVNNFQSYSKKTRFSIPLLYGVDANHGHGNVPEATIFPHQIGLGASNDPELVKKIAKATAEEVSATGINWIYSPNLDIVEDTRWGRTYETFGSDPKRTGLLGAAYIDGLEEINPHSFSIAATAKHYIANGATNWGSSINNNFFLDQGDSTISDDELRRIHLEPFRQAVQSNVKSVMVGLNKWNGKKVSANKYLLTDILKNELNFQGFVVSDWYGIYEKELNKYKAMVTSINAGVDMVMLPYNYKLFSTSMHYALANGDITQARLDDAVRRILKVKFEIGLFDNTGIEKTNLENIGSKAHKQLAREAVRKSLTLLKNNNVLPVSKNNTTILVAGSAADNIGKQSGGWTVEWQGIDGNWIPGTTILQGIQNMISSSTKIEYDIKGNFNNQQKLADIGIAVVGENPYAEGWGDKENPTLSSEDIEAISNLRKHSKKIIVIIISGRPLDIKQYSPDWDAVIAAWLPGSEGQGVADVLFGDFPFTGTLPVKWDL